MMHHSILGQAMLRFSITRRGRDDCGAGSPAALIVATLLAIPLGAGCGGGSGPDGREAVSGSVTINGAPMNDATIEFVPASQGAGSFAGATIVDGEYSVPASKGLAPATYKVMISMAGSTPEPEADEMPGDSSIIPAAPDLIPDKYNAESTLTAEVEAGGENRFDFELTK